MHLKSIVLFVSLYLTQVRSGAMHRSISIQPHDGAVERHQNLALQHMSSQLAGRGRLGHVGRVIVSDSAGHTEQLGHTGPLIGPLILSGDTGHAGHLGPAVPIGPVIVSDNVGHIGPIGYVGPIGHVAPIGHVGPIEQVAPIGHVGPIGHAGELGRAGHFGLRQHVGLQNYNLNPSYQLAYVVENQHAGDLKNQIEASLGEKVKGEYLLVEPDINRFNTIVQHSSAHH